MDAFPSWLMEVTQVALPLPSMAVKNNLSPTPVDLSLPKATVSETEPPMMVKFLGAMAIQVATSLPFPPKPHRLPMFPLVSKRAKNRSVPPLEVIFLPSALRVWLKLPVTYKLFFVSIVTPPAISHETLPNCFTHCQGFWFWACRGSINTEAQRHRERIIRR